MSLKKEASSLCLVILSVFLLLCIVSEVVGEERVCATIDVRNSVESLNALENCTVIEGQLHILLIDQATSRDYEKYSFPQLVEITDYLLIYRVYGLRSLRNLFPNLAVIRGQKLFHNYALIAYETPDLETLGLISLTTIMRGAVRLQKNTKLCYVDTIDWSKIATGVDIKDHFFEENKDEQECVNVCPDNCLQTTVGDKTAKRCWNSDNCQKNLNCPSDCGAGGQGFCTEDGICCNSYCVGGCTGPKQRDCIACRNVTYKDQCELSCPVYTYTFMNRRCLIDQECINMSRRALHDHWKIISHETSPPKPGLCVEECPNGYSIDEKDKTACKKCKDYCPKECLGKTVDSIESAQHLKGCTKIIGPLEIQIMGGSNIGLELESSLGMIQEVTAYIKIVRSYALLSLGFFKNLRVIHGEELQYNFYSLIVMDNANLQELFPEEVAANLTIKRGIASFHFNRKLCYIKIKEFLNTVKVNFTDNDVSQLTNGDLIPCSVKKMLLEVEVISKDYVILKWKKFVQADERQLLSYVINYREAKSKNVNIFQGRDACLDTVWKTRDVNPIEDKGEDYQVELLYGLDPWTQYAVYIQTYTLQTANTAANSELLFFTTNPSNPTRPRNVKVFAEEQGELRVTWDPPKKPNGPVNHYIVYWQLQELETGAFDRRDYCDNPILMPKKQNTSPQEEVNKYLNKTNVNQGECCKCPRSKKNLEEQERQRQLQIDFENNLHDTIYTKRPAEPSKRSKRSTWPDDEVFPDSKYMKYDVSDTKEKNFTIDDNSTENATKNIFHESIVYQTEIIIPNLGHFQEFNVEVLACQETNESKKYCSGRALASARTKPSPTADNINASTVSAVASKNGSKEVLVKWASPPAPNGVIITFQIEYKKISTADVEPTRICFTHKKYRKLNGYLFQRLDAGNYSYRIRATSLAGNGSFTPYFYFQVPQTGGNERIPEAVIAAAVIGVLLVIIITIIVVWFVAKSKFAKDPDVTTISMNPGYVPSADVYLPDDWEVDRDKIKLIRELGQGSFGMVYEGIAKDIGDKPYSEIKVAVKTVNDSAGWHERMSFLKEASIMKSFSCQHVVKLLGVVSKGQPALVIMELMAQGDLKNFLRLHRPDEEENAGRSPPTLKEILQMAGEIADGMAYLADKKFVHRDLAARNCMVADDNTVKIGDFGMTRDIYETDYYRKGGKGLLPVRWMAPESLKDGIFTTMSDVWSYGVVLWEMATLAAQPYQGLSNEEVLKYVADGRIMEKPDGCPEKIYQLMCMCWRYRYKKRPTFKEIIEMLVPDLDPKFKHVSYFFSDENKTEVPPDYKDIQVADESVEDLEDIEFSEQSEEDMDDVNDESRIPFMSAHQSPNLNSVEMQRSPSRHNRDTSNTSPCECVLLEEMPNGHRNSTCSSPNSGVGYSDGSKGSSKSSNSSYTQINGIANGHIHMRLPRTTPC